MPARLVTATMAAAPLATPDAANDCQTKRTMNAGTCGYSSAQLIPVSFGLAF